MKWMGALYERLEWGGVGGNVVKGGAYVQAGGWRDLHEKDGLGKAHKEGPTGGKE